MPKKSKVKEPAEASSKSPKPKKSGSGKSLVIVESPAKAKTINKILGSKFVVKACMGHVRDLPEREFGIDIENHFEPKYATVRGKSKVLNDLKESSKNADTVYLAPDPDREGEAIAWHLKEALKLSNTKARRVTFNEITKRGVLEAFERPGQISMDRVNAQQARRFLDRIVGYKLSPLLWKKVGRGLSAGRVQSVAVHLIVEREPPLFDEAQQADVRLDFVTEKFEDTAVGRFILAYLAVIFGLLPLVVLTGLTMSPAMNAAFPF